MEDSERETIINFNSADKVANVYSCHRRIQHIIERRLGIKPDRIEGRDGKEYSVPIKLISFRKPRAKRDISPEEMEKMKERGRKLSQVGKRHSKNISNNL